ncbi:MAG: FAD-dependent oxidoreductase, partial [Planctomycetes bacterium]|nr:FAD-dependent oxidoreductase [Planctomycetota bacterium]
MLRRSARRTFPRAKALRLMVHDDHYDAVIVGAGIAGLCAARALAAAGRRVILLDKGRGVGGRMATRRLGSAVCDHGAQFFTVRGRAFGAIVAETYEAGSAVEWCRGFLHDGSKRLATGDGHPRWRGARGMTDLPKHLSGSLAAVGVVVRTAAEVVSVTAAAGRALVRLEDGETFVAAGAILTAPVPQSLELLAAGGLTGAAGPPAEPAAFASLAAVGYDPCFSLLLVLHRPSRVPPPGGMQFDASAGGPIAWIADNERKGISAVPALTIHADGPFSRRQFDALPEEVTAQLIEHARPWIDGDPTLAVVETSLHRWKFATPTTTL